jgi:tripartite-type tricarboxylate transporter receptor subunit TctC
MSKVLPGLNRRAGSASWLPPRHLVNAAFVKALGDPDVIEKLRTIGAQPAPMTPEAFAAYIRSESAKWGRLTREMNLAAQ